MLLYLSTGEVDLNLQPYVDKYMRLINFIWNVIRNCIQSNFLRLLCDVVLSYKTGHNGFLSTVHDFVTNFKPNYREIMCNILLERLSN